MMRCHAQTYGKRHDADYDTAAWNMCAGVLVLGIIPQMLVS